ncbi:MAG TPA: tetratricopeptide repeat protein [Terriglobia bacterium]|jgi:tetratricopeptide (TPR) repeat protein
MKKTLLIAAVSVAVLVAGALGYFVWHRTTQTPQSFFASGKKYYDQKKYQEAAIQLLNAVRKDPRHRDARLLLARTLVTAGNLNAAVVQLKGLLEYYPDDAEGNVELGNLYLAGGRTNPEYFHQAQELARKVLAKNPNNVDALILSGTASAGLKDLDTSVDTLEKAASLDPQNPKALINLGAAQTVKKDFAGAEKSLIKAHETNPKDSRAALALADYYLVAKDPAKAEASFKDALTINPADRDTYLQAAQFYLVGKRFDDVEKVFRDAQAQSPDNPAPSLALANAYEIEKRPADVRKLLLDLKTKFPKDITVAVKLAQNLLPDQPDRALPEIDQVIKTQPKSPLGYVLLGEAQFRTGKFAEAEATLSKEPALSSPFPQVHFFLGNLATQKGQVNDAIGHFEKSAAINKNYLPARMALADLYLKTGKLADAREEVQKILAVAPGNATAQLFKTSVDIAAKNYDDAGQELLSLQKEHPDSPSVQRQLGLYYQARGKNAEAEKSLTHALELVPNSEPDFEALAGFYLRNKQPDKVVQMINRVPDASKQAFHYEAMGMAEAEAGKSQDAMRDYLKAIEKDPKRGRASQLLFEAYVHEKQFDDARKMLDASIQKNPSNGSTVALRGVILLMQGKTNDAMSNFEKALQLDPNQDIAANNEAYLLAEQGRDLETALKYAQAVRRRRSEDPNAADTLGWVYYKMGRFTPAVDELQFAASKQPANPVFQYHLGAIFKANNQRSEAETALKKALATKADFKERSEAEALLQNIEYWRHLPGSTTPAKSK